MFKIHYRSISLEDDIKPSERVVDIFVSFDKVHRLIKEDMADYITQLWNIFDNKDELYKDNVVIKIIFEYWIKENQTGKPLQFLSTLKGITKTKNPQNKVKIISKIIDGIPLNNEYLSWGTVVQNENGFIMVRDTLNTSKTYHIYEANTLNSKSAPYFKIDMRVNNKNITTFEDHALQGTRPSLFKRIVTNYEFYIENKTQQIVLKTIKFKTDYLKPLVKEKKIINKMITLDIETRVFNNSFGGEHIPYCVCYYDGTKKY